MFLFFLFLSGISRLDCFHAEQRDILIQFATGFLEAGEEADGVCNRPAGIEEAACFREDHVSVSLVGDFGEEFPDLIDLFHGFIIPLSCVTLHWEELPLSSTRFR